MNASTILELLSGNIVAIGWGLVIIASLLLIYRYGLRPLEPRSSAVFVTALILLISVGPFAMFYLYSLPKVRADSAAEFNRVREKLAMIDLDNVKQNDLSVAYQRENADLNRTLIELRAQSESLNNRFADLESRNEKLKRKNTAYQDENSRLKKKVASLEKNSRPKPDRTPPSGRKAEKRGPSEKPSIYMVSITTPERNQSLCRSIESALKRKGFQIQSIIPMEVNESRLVYYSESNEGKAKIIAALLKREYDIHVRLKLSQNRSRKNSFQIFLKP